MKIWLTNSLIGTGGGTGISEGFLDSEYDLFASFTYVNF